jgi:hypothetical protein
MGNTIREPPCPIQLHRPTRRESSPGGLPWNLSSFTRQQHSNFFAGGQHTRLFRLRIRSSYGRSSSSASFNLLLSQHLSLDALHSGSALAEGGAAVVWRHAVFGGCYGDGEGAEKDEEGGGEVHFVVV